MARYIIIIQRKAKNGSIVKKSIWGDPDLEETAKSATNYARQHYKTATSVFIANEETHEHTTKYL